MTIEKDPRYPDAVQSDEPEFESVEKERDYWKGLALSYAAKLGALQVVMNKSWTASVDPETAKIVVFEDGVDNV